MMRHFIIIGLIILMYYAEVFPQKDFRVMFYNVENFFDTEDNPLKDDDEFLPDGFMQWTPWKYWEKHRNITRVVTAVGGMYSPALIGLCEIENDSTLFDLTKRSPLRAQEYSYIITDSPDDRGINVALLYQRLQFRPVVIQEYEVQFSQKNTRPTRNILHVCGEMINGHLLDVFVCHFPSRSGGQKETEPARIDAAKLLKNKVDSIFAQRHDANIIIMGDFNDHPTNKSLSHILEASSIENPLLNNRLYNLFHISADDPEFGSYKYQGRWEVLDQFIVSGALLSNQNGILLKNKEAHVFKADFLLVDDDKYYGKKPSRTNSGPRYLGGFSDHLPIYLDLSITPSAE